VRFEVLLVGKQTATMATGGAKAVLDIINSARHLRRETTA
jgi:hypothetical protein